MIASSLIVFSSLFGALPPLAQSFREIQAIVSDSRTLEFLGSAALLHKIVKTKEGYLIVTQDRILRVDVNYLPATKMGPVPFELYFYEQD